MCRLGSIALGVARRPKDLWPIVRVGVDVSLAERIGARECDYRAGIFVPRWTNIRDDRSRWIQIFRGGCQGGGV